MQLLASPADPWWLREFSATVRRPDGPVDLGRAAWLLAAHRSEHARSAASVESGLRDLDRLAQRAGTTAEGWHRLLFVDLALSGNGIDYHDVRNSFLPDVLLRRVGIPISIAVIALEVGRRVGLDIDGIGLPGHFLLSCRDPQGIRFLDPFHAGAEVELATIEQRFHAMFGDDQPFRQEFLAPVDADAILSRMLANLKQNYARLRDLPGLRDVLRLRSCLPELSVTEVRELVRLDVVLGDTGDALRVLDEASAQLMFEAPAAIALLDAERERITAGFN